MVDCDCNPILRKANKQEDYKFKNDLECIVRLDQFLSVLFCCF